MISRTVVRRFLYRENSVIHIRSGDVSANLSETGMIYYSIEKLQKQLQEVPVPVPQDQPETRQNGFHIPEWVPYVVAGAAVVGGLAYMLYTGDPSVM